MLNIIKKNTFLILIFISTLSIGFITFLTFINKSFVELNETNLQLLLILNIVLLLIFFFIIYREISFSLKNKSINDYTSRASIKYITFFSLFTLIPSILIAVFSLFLFSFALDKYLDKKITSAVNNSYKIAKNYVEEVRNKIESDIVLISLNLNKNINIYYDNPNLFKNILKNHKLRRNLDHIYLVDSAGNLIISANLNDSEFIPPSDKALNLVLTDDRPLKIIDAYENKSAAIIKLPGYIDTYLYIVKFLDTEISNYLKETSEAISFYYTVENKRIGIKISFVLIYLVVVSLMLFLSISMAIKFSSRFFTSINNLITASTSISDGNLDAKVPVIKSDDELEKLNRNFNLMIDKLKDQQDKLLLTARHEAWENVARKLAHEIKNPLTPIQLSTDRLKHKYLNLIKDDNKKDFENYLKTIDKQIKEIENLVNEFSDFARMPKPIFKKTDIIKVIESNVSLLEVIDKKIDIKIINYKKNIIVECDEDQIRRVFLNIVKNAIESIQEKSEKSAEFDKKIDIEISDENDYITVTVQDNGTGLPDKNLNEILKPYYTTKIKGSGLGLSIVSKIINDHNGKIQFISKNVGAKILITLPKNV